MAAIALSALAVWIAVPDSATSERALRVDFETCQCFELAPHPGPSWSALVLLRTPTTESVVIETVRVRVFGHPRFLSPVQLVVDGARPKLLVEGMSTGAAFPRQWRGFDYPLLNVSSDPLPRGVISSLMIRYSLAPSTLIGGFDTVSLRIRQSGSLYTRTFKVGTAECAGRLSGNSDACDNATYPLYQRQAGEWRSIMK